MHCWRLSRLTWLKARLDESCKFGAEAEISMSLALLARIAIAQHPSFSGAFGVNRRGSARDPNHLGAA